MKDESMLLYESFHPSTFLGKVYLAVGLFAVYSTSVLCVLRRWLNENTYTMLSRLSVYKTIRTLVSRVRNMTHDTRTHAHAHTLRSVSRNCKKRTSSDRTITRLHDLLPTLCLFMFIFVLSLYLSPNQSLFALRQLGNETFCKTLHTGSPVKKKKKRDEPLESLKSSAIYIKICIDRACGNCR